MRNLELSQETAKRWYEGTDEELKALALQTYPELAKKELPKSWQELKKLSGCYINLTSDVKKAINFSSIKDNESIFTTKEQAEASIALAQLSQLREVYRNVWVPDWSSNEEYKYCIDFEYNKPTKNTYNITPQFLSFQDEKTRDLFLKNFRDLIEKAKPLMS